MNRSFLARIVTLMVQTLILAVSGIAVIAAAIFAMVLLSLDEGGRSVDDTAGLFPAAIVLLAGGIAYVMGLLPWVRKLRLLHRWATTVRRSRLRTKWNHASRMRAIHYVIGAFFVPLLALLVTAVWTRGDAVAAERGIGMIPAACTLFISACLYGFLYVPSIRRKTFASRTEKPFDPFEGTVEPPVPARKKPQIIAGENWVAYDPTSLSADDRAEVETRTTLGADLTDWLK